MCRTGQLLIQTCWEKCVFTPVPEGANSIQTNSCSPPLGTLVDMLHYPQVSLPLVVRPAVTHDSPPLGTAEIYLIPMFLASEFRTYPRFMVMFNG